MKSETMRRGAVTLVAVLAMALSACGSRSSPVQAGGQGGGAGTAKTFRICPGPEAQKESLIAFFEAREGDTIEYCAGQFDFDTGLIMTGKKGITIKGAGREKTILSFKTSGAQDGININQVEGITVQNLTIYDAPGNGLRIFRSKYITVRGVKVGWSNADPASPNYDASRESWSENGAYAFYPVVSRHILIEDSVSIGSSDAGVYVGQSSDILVRRTEAFHNVAGFEFENTYRAEFVDNIAHDNVGGFLVFDLPGRVQFGEKNLVHRNKSYNNNLPQFAPRGSIVAVIPPGTGMLVAAADQVEFYDNEIYDNKTTGLAIVNYGLADSGEPATNYDFFPEGIHIYNNKFRNNGYAPELPDPARSSCKGGPGIPAGFPGPDDSPDCLADNATLLPAIILLKNAGKSAHIVWDGAEDAPNDCSKVPVDADGIALNQPNARETARPEPRTDERGRPNLYQYDPIPECKWSAWKFNAEGALKKPANGMCVEDNEFENTSPQGQLVDDFVNFRMATADFAQIVTPANHDQPQDCPTVAASLLPRYVPVLGSFTPNPANDPRPSEAAIAAACGKAQAGKLNMEALLKYNCPRLDQYGLFKDPTDPRRTPNGNGMPFELNTILFSDYASKYRFMFLPDDSAGRPQKALYQDHEDCETLNIYSCYTQTLKFPVGTVFSKTFTFKDGDNEDVVETRLLIKRQKADGTVFWIGLPYLWSTDSSGRRVAVLKIEGDTKAAHYDYDNPDPGAVDGTGQRQHYSGSVEKYAIPNAGACIVCHSGDDLEPGSPPIGPKVRNLNRDNLFPDVAGPMNQLAYMKMKGYLDLPGEPSALEKMARFDVPGSSGAPANSAEDVHQRVRAFLEVNCMHCHNPAGNAQNSGLQLESFTEPMGQGNGICKVPIAAGKAADFGTYDIQPGNAAASILPNRVASTQAGSKMPPLARSVMQTEAVDLINRWVNEAVAGHADAEANFCGTQAAPAVSAPRAAPAAQTRPFG
ncbi:MAG TPA: parallel beta-helix domain-containing protein [Solimonas sp.]|nr:parallel beta-helix domain-containing protein [Solimonas sp.]